MCSAKKVDMLEIWRKILIVEEPIIFEFEVRLSTQRLMFESLWYKHMDMIWELVWIFVIISEWLSWGEINWICMRHFWGYGKDLLAIEIEFKADHSFD